MATRVYAILSRSALGEGQPVVIYDERPIDFDEAEHAPVWILATDDGFGHFSLLQFDESATQTWVHTTVGYAREHLEKSIFAEFEITGMAMSDVQIKAAEERAAIAVSDRLVVILGNPEALHLVNLLRFHPTHQVRTGDGSVIEIPMDNIALLDAPDLPRRPHRL